MAAKAGAIVGIVGLLVACASTAEGPGPAERRDAGRGEVDAGEVDAALTVERCGNGLDDDADARIDEECSCVPGSSQECFDGPPTLAGVGRCTRGTQGCEGEGEFGTWSSCFGDVLPREDTCDDGVDDDCNGVIDDGPSCTCAEGETRACYSGPDGTRDVGICMGGNQQCMRVGASLAWGPCFDEVLPRAEICGNGVDDDCNGPIDDAPGCECLAGSMRACYGGPPSEINIGICRPGEQSCMAPGVWSGCVGEIGPTAELCHNGLDDNCNGMIDEGCSTVVMLMVDLHGDCITTRCPDSAPYPVACEIMMAGDDHRGCVASSATNPVVYFQEGDACGAGRVTGTLSCSSTPGVGLNESNCRINKSTKYYPSSRSGCPDTDG